MTPAEFLYYAGIIAFYTVPLIVVVSVAVHIARRPLKCSVCRRPLPQDGICRFHP